MPPAVRVAFVHALQASIEPLNAALDEAWPEVERMHVLDDSLSRDRARGAALDGAMQDRFHALAEYALMAGAQGILFSCSAFGLSIEGVARRRAPIPVLKPNEAMIDAVTRLTSRVGVVATFAPTLEAIVTEFPPQTQLRCVLAKGAMAALAAGDMAHHDALIAEASASLVDDGCEVIALSQFSMARARAVVEAAVSVPVYTTVDSAVQLMRTRMIDCIPEARV